MTRRVTAVAGAWIAAVSVAGVAIADSGHSAKSYKASLAAVDPAASTAGLATVVGKAQLVDGKKNNKVSLHLRHLAAGTVYLWHVHEGSCAATGAPRGRVDVPGPMTPPANGTLDLRRGRQREHAAGRSATFTADPGKSYSVNVHVSTLTNGLGAGTIITCGDLKIPQGRRQEQAQQARPRTGQGPQALDGRHSARAPGWSNREHQAWSGFRPALTRADRLHARRTRESPAGERGCGRNRRKPRLALRGDTPVRPLGSEAALPRRPRGCSGHECRIAHGFASPPALAIARMRASRSTSARRLPRTSRRSPTRRLTRTRFG